MSDSLNITEAEAASKAVSHSTRVSLLDIENNIAAEMYLNKDILFEQPCRIVSSDADEKKIIESLGVLTIVIIVLKNGFSVIGKAAPVDAKNFDAVMGVKLAREDAIRQIWPLMGYAMREKLMGLFAFIAFSFLLSVAPTSAHASTVDLSPIIDYGFDTLAALAMSAVSAGVLAFTGFAARKFKISADIEIQRRAEDVLEKAIAYSITYAKNKVKDLKLNDVELKNQFLAVALNYIIPKIPDTLKKLKIADKVGWVDQKELEQRILARAYDAFDTPPYLIGFTQNSPS